MYELKIEEYANGTTKVYLDGKPDVEQKRYINSIEDNPKGTKLMSIAEREEALGYIEEQDKAIAGLRENLEKLKRLIK